MSKAEKTRQFIIEKTAPIFNKKGYAGTSLSDLTEATGLTKGSIYGNFENKDEVAVEAFLYNLKNLQDKFRQAIDKETTYKDKLMVFPILYQDFFASLFLSGGCPILNTAIEADDTHELLKSHANNAINSWKNRIITLIEKGIEENEFKSDINPEQIALTIIATIEGAIMITKLSGKVNYLKLIMESIKKMINDLT